MKRGIALLVIVCFLTSGCATTVRTAGSFKEHIKEVKTIAVMPIDVTVYRLTAGGMQEEMDEWSANAQTMIKESLESHLAERYTFEIKYIDEDWLKANHKELWEDNKALYSAVSLATFQHGMPFIGQNIFPFPTKKENFDYTLGDELSRLKEVVEADDLLFVYAYDNESTAGRKGLWLWSFGIGLFTGVMILPLSPSFFSMALVNGTTGDIEWFKTTPPDSVYSFQSKNDIEDIVEWITRNFKEDQE